MKNPFDKAVEQVQEATDKLLESGKANRQKLKVTQKLATSGSLEELKKLVAEFYYSKPERITFTDAGTHWTVKNGEKTVTPVVVQQGKKFVFGSAS